MGGMGMQSWWIWMRKRTMLRTPAGSATTDDAEVLTLVSVERKVK